jgi:outer membrane protein, heavy metal efflux system
VGIAEEQERVMNRFNLGLIGLCCAASLAHGQTTESDPILAYLPAAQTVQQVLLASPALQGALAQKSAQMHRADMTASGPAEFTLRMNQQSRRVQQPQDRFAETSISLERPLRWWGKAQLDADLATQSREVARIGYADALHEASRGLMQQWFSLRKAQVDRDSTATSLRLAQALVKQAQARLKQGDISQLDADLAQAELQRCEAALQAAQSQHATVQITLNRLYPGLPLEPPSAMIPPLPDLRPMADLQRIYLENHHELNLWRAEAARMRLLADRVNKDQWPDPTVGVYTMRERQGAEQVVGVSLSLPLAGQVRQSHALAVQAEAQNTQDKVRQLQAQLGADFEARWTEIQHHKQAAQHLEMAARIQGQAADKSLKAYAVGEHTMTELLQNQRLANEQRRESERMRWDVVERQALLTLDLHQIWDFDE